MRALAEFIMRGRMQATLVVVGSAALPLLFWLSAAAGSLVLLRRGLSDAIGILAWALLPAIGWWYFGEPRTLLVLLGALGLACVLRANPSWRRVLLFSIALGLVYGLVLGATFREPIEAMAQELTKLLPQMLDGALVTLQVALLSMVIGLALALALTACRLSGNRILGGFATAWVEIARNTPALFQIYMAHFGLGNFGIHLSPYTALLVGIAFNNAGYLAENFRGALKAIPDTQARAGRSLGMTSLQAFRYIVMPQMLRIAFLPATNQMVWAILMTSLGVTVGMPPR